MSAPLTPEEIREKSPADKFEDYLNNNIDSVSKNGLTDEEIREGNEILARFDGWDFMEGSNLILQKDDNIIGLYELSYHTDYNLIHKIYTKLYEIKFEKPCKEGYQHIFMLAELQSIICTKPISESFRSLVSAVKWFNSIK